MDDRKQVKYEVPRWTTSWPDWYGYGIHCNVSVVPAMDYDALRQAIESELPSGMVELVLEKAHANLNAAAQKEDKHG